ncbi:MAG: hypothetical protein A6F70_04115 [Cycloclasticus sp. symbiont of Bathymodiolus heckerae]|nr:MAG: hypothetical protein A6F70_04115 [Cycloclasticus sp. symbiont of Bathymodiolus heckerae]
MSVSKFSCIALLGLGLTACSSLPSMDGVFIDQKEEYKKAHELPVLEVPPELSAGSVRDEYDGSARGTLPIPSVNAVVQTAPLGDEQPAVELMKGGVNTYLLVRDSLRNTWRKTISALEELDYDIEDKNRQRGKVYLNIASEGKSGNMLSSLSFWEKADITVYVLALDHQENGVSIRVLSEEKGRIDNKVSKRILSDLIGQLEP